MDRGQKYYWPVRTNTPAYLYKQGFKFLKKSYNNNYINNEQGPLNNERNTKLLTSVWFLQYSQKEQNMGAANYRNLWISIP